MKRTVLIIIALCLLGIAHAQPDRKYSRQQLKQDADFLKQQLFTVHAYPYTEFSHQRYEQLFNKIDSQLQDSLSASAFLKILKPAFAYLSDEHAGVEFSKQSLPSIYKEENIYLPFTLTKKNGKYLIGSLLTDQSTLYAGEEITSINNIPIEQLVKKAALATSGYADQRSDKALKQFGYLYTYSQPSVTDHFRLRANGKIYTITGLKLKVWQDFINKQTGWDTPCRELVAYEKIGNTGYITSCSFSTPDSKLDSVNNRLQAIFKQIKQDGVSKLVIDVSHNGGGNSSVGELLINHFYSQPYKSYQCNFKRSDDYLKLIKSWGLQNPGYEAQPVGTVIHTGPDVHTPPAEMPDRFDGKVYVVIGNGTFSSAIMFATQIKDNHMATLVGETPQNGHPDHFGEMYNNELPNTKLTFRFGVKEWIRPAGKQKNNLLFPDKYIDLGHANTPERIVATIQNY